MPSRTSAKSAKAIKAAGKSSPSLRKGGGGGKLPTKKNIPWMTIGAGVVIVALIGAIAAYIVPKYRAQDEMKNPAAYIDGTVQKSYDAGLHVASTQRVAYDQAPAFGGPHDSSWAACTGVVYAKAIRTENAVHSLEHGAVWITYNPDKLDAASVDTLKKKVEGQPYMLMSPYPNLDKPISLQAWGHQLKVEKADDSRVDRFIKDLRLNPNTYPEVGASCANPTFDVNNPPAFDPSAPGPDAVPMDGKGLTPDTSELGGTGGLPGGGMPGGTLGGSGLGGLDGSGLPTDLFPTVPVPADGQTEIPLPGTDAPAAGQ
ncbi:DUF3105 domain-containing protein [Nocardia huaxiensis]|uniref:DUF3105 domain-containing protein n=1 Tax=Nocardia huaxiensis TaxID=2755382 RepID=UPI001E476D0E|nr:DUF3105 domain-containing protein [Nocardia huaxiensis]UFS95704.1 DUF3105 domain-containing protein [Nocardia huaxiensis]